MKKFLIYIFVFFLFGCVADDHFGLSSRKDIKEFTIPNQAGATTIDKENLIVEVPVSEDYNIESVSPTKIVLSNMASVTPGEMEAVDFSNGPVIYSVTAEDKSIADWNVTLNQQKAEIQLPNSNYDLWYDAGGYPEPGDGTTPSTWATANKALALVGQYNTEPVSDGNSGFYAKMVTIPAPAVVRIAAATLFTGTFKDGFPSIDDPRSNTLFGVPYTSTPTAFKLRYKYQSGEIYADGDGNALPGSDACDIYVILEQWIDQGSAVKKLRVATAWYRSSDIITDWTDLNKSFVYGELASSEPDYMKPSDGYAEQGAKPTHISVVYSSSALGDLFTGAIGSTLEVDDFELLY